MEAQGRSMESLWENPETSNLATMARKRRRNRQTTKRDQLAIQRRVLTIRFFREAGAKAEEEPKARARRRAENFMFIVVYWCVERSKMMWSDDVNVSNYNCSEEGERVDNCLGCVK